MSKLDKLYIAATGMITPVGINSAMTASSVKAGINVYQQSDYINKKDKPMTTAWVPDDALPELHEDLQWIGLKGDEKRLIQLSSAALSELQPLLPKKTSITLFLAGPENIPARPKPITQNIINHIHKQSGVPFDLSSSRYLENGRAGVIEAIDLAFEYMSMTEKNCVLVGGVDTYCNTGLISRLDIEDRILALNITDGFALGEAAGFLLLTKDPHHSFLPVSLSLPGLAEEEGHRYSNEPYRGDGLASAVTSAIELSNGAKISHLYSSMNGESFSVKEFGVSSIRNSECFSDGYQVTHPADCYGDIGAATGAVLVALSAMNFKDKVTERNNNVSDQQHIICCSSDMSNRAAICMRAEAWQ